MIAETLATLEMMSGIPREALLGAPFALGAGMHLVNAQSGQGARVHAAGAWKGLEQRVPLLSPLFIQVAMLGLVFGSVLAVAALTGWMPGLSQN
ncbi:MAG: hypothetical protein MUF14_05040 [Hyphomonadaceae bacterium]|jgi:hypothetical protein|nr:hypothetical protein [Hyphomonadaceae bacterium]